MNSLLIVAVSSSICLGNGYIIGMDFGTTFSCVGVMTNGKIKIIPNTEGNRVTPSVVSFTDQMQLIGEDSDLFVLNPNNTVYQIKQIIGRKYADQAVQQYKMEWPVEVINIDGKPHVKIQYQQLNVTLTPEEIAAMILLKMKQNAEAYLGSTVQDVVVPVPAYFDDSQKAAIKQAGSMAGLNIIRIIDEPTAAAIAYGLDKKHTGTNIIVYDLGGTKLDVSLLTLDDGIFEVEATNTVTHLGGQYFNERVMDYFIKRFHDKNKMDIGNNDRAMTKLTREVEKAKRVLSSTTHVRIEIPNFINDIDFSETLDRAIFEELNHDLFIQTLNSLRMILKDTGMKKSEIDEIVLVGGSTKMPKIQELVSQFFNGKEPNTVINPEYVVVYGAATVGEMIYSYKGVVVCNMSDTTPLSFGIETLDAIMMIIVEKNTVYPTKKTIHLKGNKLPQVKKSSNNDIAGVVIRLFQGERINTADNIFLGEYILNGHYDNTINVEITIEIDAKVTTTLVTMDDINGKNYITVDVDQVRRTQEEIDDMLTITNTK